MVFYETSLLRHARHKGFDTENGKILTDFELLAKLQHHGAATRLVDFSKNVLVALWFAIQDNKEETGLLTGIHVRQ